MLKQKFPLALMLIFLSTNEALALKTCSDQDVVNLVCKNRNPVMDTSCHSTYDGTGFGERFEDLNDARITPLTVAQTTTIDDAAYAKFTRLFGAVKSSYAKLFEALQGDASIYYLNRMKELRLPTKLELTSNMDYEGVMAWYDDKRDLVRVTPSLLNVNGLSELQIERTLAHEFGHFFDPKWQGGTPRITGAYKGNECFERNTKSDLHRAEDFAEWMATQVSDSLFSKTNDANLDFNQTLNLAYSFCDRPLKNPIVKALKRYNNRGMSKIDGHRSSIERIVALMESPKILERIGCRSPLIYQKTIQPYKDCRL